MSAKSAASGSHAADDQVMRSEASADGAPTQKRGERRSGAEGVGAAAGDVVRTAATEPRPGIPSSIVHELRTPLTAIHGYAQLLQRSLSNPAMAERAVAVILGETKRLSELLNQLYEVAELDSRPLTPAPTRTKIMELARSAAEQAAPRSDKHELVVVGDPEVECHCDPRRLSQILAHLLSNAICYSPDGGRVTIGVEREPGAVHLTVTDPGIGIPPEEAERVYERYFRGREAQRTGVRGLGLGLYVASEVASRTGARVWHEPGDGRGTVFHVLVPDA